MARQRKSKAGSGTGHVRIIAGEWRGRKLPVADVPGLRPSGDRARETLFNWLQADLPGARCVDLFAGTGALGFEAASRGAAHVTLIEKHRRAADVLRGSQQMLDADQVEVVEADAVEWLKQQSEKSLDLIFVDPPFASELAVAALDMILESGCLKSNGVVYFESARLDSPGFIAGWSTLREKNMGEVSMRLLKESKES